MSKAFPDGSTLKRYDLPSIDGLEGWATIVLGADGFFAAVTDYGNYAYRWCHTGDDDFRVFMARRPLDPGYVLGKISEQEYDNDATVKAIRERIEALESVGALTEDCADDERQFADDLEDDGDFSRWYRETSIEEAFEYRCEQYPCNARAFAEKTLARLADVLRAEIAAESKSR